MAEANEAEIKTVRHAVIVRITDSGFEGVTLMFMGG